MASRRDAEVNAIFVDLTNFYTRLIKTGLLEPDQLRSYFMEWFDFSALSTYLTRKMSDTWIFHSETKLGPPEAKIDGSYLKKLITRFDAQVGITTQNVNIAGEQREPFTIKCAECGTEGDAIWKSEKGIDSSLIVHLFDTMEYWDRAYLVSGDADFVPAVRSLRRRGKIVNGAGFNSQASPALIRECFHYFDLSRFFLQDLSAYMLFSNSGRIHTLITKYLRKEPRKSKAGEIVPGKFTVSFSLYHSFESNLMTFEVSSDIIEFDNAADELPPLKIDGQYNYRFVTFDSKLYDHLERKIEQLASKIDFDFSKDESHQYSKCQCFGYFTWSEKKGSYVQTSRDSE